MSLSPEASRAQSWPQVLIKNGPGFKLCGLGFVQTPESIPPQIPPGLPPHSGNPWQVLGCPPMHTLGPAASSLLATGEASPHSSGGR
jgi:hypothetical protein